VVPCPGGGLGRHRRFVNKLAGTLRTTASTKGKRDARSRIPFTSNDDDYDGNIQIADLNALNAALAVLKWKKMSGFYAASSSRRGDVDADPGAQQAATRVSAAGGALSPSRCGKHSRRNLWIAVGIADAFGRQGMYPAAGVCRFARLACAPLSPVAALVRLCA
jgi:hypothetical protein